MLISQQHTTTNKYSNGGSIGKNSLITTIESCVFNINDHYRKKKEQEFTEGLLSLQQYCSQLNDESERKLSNEPE